MTKIKVCGLKRLQDIEYVNELIPDYVGFVFAKSKRQVNMKMAEELIGKLNNTIKTVGVFVNEDVKKVKNIAENLKLDVLQFHGEEDEKYFSEIKEFHIWKSMSIKVELNEFNSKENFGKSDLQDLSKNYTKDNNNFYKLHEYQKDLDILNKYDIEAVLLDSSIKGVQGGTGISFDWDIIPKLKIDKKLILAGGLNKDNVLEAIDKGKPFAVDVSSGVETGGVKDFNKIKTFIEKVRTIK